MRMESVRIKESTRRNLMSSFEDGERSLSSDAIMDAGITVGTDTHSLDTDGMTSKTRKPSMSELSSETTSRDLGMEEKDVTNVKELNQKVIEEVAITVERPLPFSESQTIIIERGVLTTSSLSDEKEPVKTPPKTTSMDENAEKTKTPPITDLTVSPVMPRIDLQEEIHAQEKAKGRKKRKWAELLKADEVTPSWMSKEKLMREKELLKKSAAQNQTRREIVESESSSEESNFGKHKLIDLFLKSRAMKRNSTRQMQNFCTSIKSNFVTEFMSMRRKKFRYLEERKDDLENNEGGWMNTEGDYKCDHCGMNKLDQDNGAEMYCDKNCVEQWMEDSTASDKPEIVNEFIRATTTFEDLHKDRFDVSGFLSMHPIRDVVMDKDTSYLVEDEVRRGIFHFIEYLGLVRDMNEQLDWQVVLQRYFSSTYFDYETTVNTTILNDIKKCRMKEL